MTAPTEIKLRNKSRILEIAWADGARYELGFEYLRVFSPSAARARSACRRARKTS